MIRLYVMDRANILQSKSKLSTLKRKRSVKEDEQERNLSKEHQECKEVLRK